MNRYWIAAAALGAPLLFVGAFLWGHESAGDCPPNGFSHASLNGKPIIELATAIDTATRHVAGDILKVELEREDGRFVYEIKVLAADGQIREVEIDSRDGSLIEIEDD